MHTGLSCSTPSPELLAPAGDFDSARAAVENGADAVYFGLRDGLNARARAVNFAPEELPGLMAYLHRRGVRGYVTLNTLVFPAEFGPFESAARQAIAAGVDAALVQDFGAARLLHALAPDWPLHASTQMSLTSAEGIRAAESLGIRRVVLARELSIEEIGRIRAETPVELEVFVHGALCISYSGQCMASLAMGGRSGNRGQCAQPCRLPYEVRSISVLAGAEQAGRSRYEAGWQPAPQCKYPLSPLDLAAYDLIPELIDAGVRAMKIEGRLKSAEYVAAVTRLYRRAIDEALAGRRLTPAAEDLEEIEVAFSRGFSHGWLDGSHHRRLVPGHTSANRGVYLGQVRAVRRGRVAVQLAASIRRGDGIVFQGDRSEDDEQGGRVYGVFRHDRPLDEPVADGIVELSFGRNAVDLRRLSPGQDVWKTDDPQVSRRLRRSFARGRTQRRVALDLVIEAAPGQQMRITARAESGAACELSSDEPLQEALRHELTAATLREQFGRLGGTVYRLRQLESRIQGRPMAPLSVLGRLRHELVRKLDEAAERTTIPATAAESPLGDLRAQGLDEGGDVLPQAALTLGHHANGRSRRERGPDDACATTILCRSLEQLDTVLGLGAASVMADFQEIDRYAEAVQMAHDHAAEILLATPRIQKPGEMAVVEAILAHRPDGILARNLGSLVHCAARRTPVVADFSLHAANDLSVRYLLGLGAVRVTAAYDLDDQQLLELATLVPPGRLEVVTYRHVPLFHTEHCVFCAVLAGGNDKTVGWDKRTETLVGLRSRPSRTATDTTMNNGGPVCAVPPMSCDLVPPYCEKCGPACRRHEVRLRDRRGVAHPLRADAGCRNTLYHAEPQNLGRLAPALAARGVRHLRIELLDESQEEIARRVR